MAIARVNGIEIFYETAGEGDPVLLIHGLGSCTLDWEYQIPDFAQSHRVIAMDVRGHGQSGKPAGPYSVKQFAEDAAALLEHLQAAPAHIVGLSMGGMIAFQMAVDAPHAVRSMTIVNSGPEMILRTLVQKAVVRSRFAVGRIFGMRTLARGIAGRLFPKPEQAEWRKTCEDRIARNEMRPYFDSLRAIDGWSVASHIGGIRCPVLVVASDHDYTPVDVKRAYASQIPNARVAVLEDSRHAGPIDQSAQFNRLVRDFLFTLSHSGS
jgi:3-oxoadipate enol-lactonase